MTTALNANPSIHRRQRTVHPEGARPPQGQQPQNQEAPPLLVEVHADGPEAAHALAPAGLALLCCVWGVFDIEEVGGQSVAATMYTKQRASLLHITHPMPRTSLLPILSRTHLQGDVDGGPPLGVQRHGRQLPCQQPHRLLALHEPVQ